MKLQFIIYNLLFCITAMAQLNNNPFLTDYNTPFQTAPFDKIKEEHFLPAFREGMRLHNEEIDAITSNPSTPTFNNTIEALERSGKVLSKVQYVFYNLLHAETNDSLDKIAETISPEETEHANSIYLNEKLFLRVKKIYDIKDSLHLTAEESTLLQRTYDAFVAQGANLSDEDKQKYRDYTKELSMSTLQFGQHVLKETNKYELLVIDIKDLSGIPTDILEVAHAKASSKQKEGWLFDLTYPSYIPFMKYADNRALRQQLYMAYNTKAIGGENDNQAEVAKIVTLRLQIAQLLGYEDYAAYVLRKRMAKDTQSVYKLLDDLLIAYKPKAIKEVEELQEFAKNKGADFSIMPWDWSYYSEKLKEEKYSVNDELLKPYFELENVKKGVFGLATRLYGLDFKKNNTIPVYNPEVEVFEVYDATGKFMAVLYTDFHPRKGKQNGAWMTEFKGQKMENGLDSRPHISLVMNFTRPTKTNPALLTFDEFTTFLHEFGHSLHGMLSECTYESLSGTNVYRDFVELPSQLMENWATEKEFLDGFAVHYKTGEKIPDELITKIKTSENFNVGYACLRQLSFGYLDMAWHTQKKAFTGNVLEFEKKAWEKSQILPVVNQTCMSTQFSHIFSGGYSAGYYSYKWAEVLDADAFYVFKKEGVLNPVIAKKFREKVLSKGGSENPMVLYKNFRGQEPTIDALLIRNGIK